MKRQKNFESAQPPRSCGGTLLGVFIGLVIGVLISFGVVWMLNKTPLPFQDKVGQVGLPEVPANGQLPAPLPGKPGDKAGVGERPRFEFYKILPGGQEAMPASAAPAPAVAPLPAGESIYLQVGAFQKLADADKLKAKLIMMGMEVAVHDVSIPDKGAMHRVRVGPFASINEMNRVRNQMSDNGIPATVVRVKEASN
ncbi:MAG: SPOR domain-containing protein [Candidatus Nitricoxidivorans perseverans]|uniref:SPOR domain-containing protein n=1 Tax=Candidatus Nitricoxidivorans perseverans TaxID=2975601 RepID=A0AA49FJL8_9PROT|nr:MAG: SPOR domain-containing protein [Candidatus Nitricoxidivorans perseverans]